MENTDRTNELRQAERRASEFFLRQTSAAFGRVEVSTANSHTIGENCIASRYLPLDKILEIEAQYSGEDLRYGGRWSLISSHKPAELLATLANGNSPKLSGFGSGLKADDRTVRLFCLRCSRCLRPGASTAGFEPLPCSC